MTALRFLVAVDKAWGVTITCPGHRPEWHRPRQMQVRESASAARFPAPPEGACPGDEEHPYCLADGDAVQQVYEEVALDRQPRGEHTLARFGRFLFDSLIGAEAWAEMRAIAEEAQARTVELALCWAPDEHDLNRLNWELMHDGEVFLVAGRGRASVTVTRVVPGTGAEGRVLHSPVRVLFVIGAPITDRSIRPAVEFLGLIRQVKASGLPLHHRVLERASPKLVKEAMASFRPDVVHFICHGEIDMDGRAYLKLQSDEPGEQEQRRYGDQLLIDLDVRGELPAAVVLSACHTAAPRLLGAHETAPLAAELVRGGVPVVAGMAGRVSDRACRLFTRRLITSLVEGESLVAATALARKAAFSDGPPPWRSVDWAFPALFLSAHVDAGYRPVVADGDDGETAQEWISRFGLDEPPIFCGRETFFAACADALGHPAPAVIAISVRGSGLGRTRLLKELAKQALAEGNIPLLVGRDGDEEGKFGLRDFCKAVARAVMWARIHLDLPHADSHLQAVVDYDHTQDAETHPVLDRRVVTALRADRDVTGPVFRLAAERDFVRLAADARARHKAIGDAEGKVMLLIDGIDETSADLIAALLVDGVLTGNGLGTARERVPVVMAFRLTGRDSILKEVDEERIVYKWLKLMRLQPFSQDDDEDLLAYEHVLLNPFRPQFDPGVSDVPWVFNPDLEEEERNHYVGELRKHFNGLPSFFIGDRCYDVVRTTLPRRWVLKADDDELVRRALESR